MDRAFDFFSILSYQTASDPSMSPRLYKTSKEVYVCLENSVDGPNSCRRYQHTMMKFFEWGLYKRIQEDGVDCD